MSAGTERFKRTIASILHRLGVSADFLTFLGLFFAAAAGYEAYHGNFFLAGALLLISGTLDMLDGAVARAAGRANRFGGILDSSLDRYGDSFVFGGILFYFFSERDFLKGLLTVSALIGSFLISYVRARAECEVESCRIGFWERGERIVYLALGLVLDNLTVVLTVLALGTHWTAIQRGIEARRQVLSAGDERLAPQRLDRRRPVYLVKVAALVLLALFWRPA